MGRFGNEAIELTNENITSHDNIADLFFFDVLSFFLAFNSAGMNYLTKDLGMQVWSLQPMFLPQKGDFTNTGQSYIFRPNYFKGSIRPFFFIGMQNLLGASYNIDDKHTITTAVGMAITDPLEQKGKFATTFFFEKNKNLLASLYLNGTEDYRFRLNLYPGLVKYRDTKLGFLIGQKRNKDNIVGININFPIGVAGIASGR